MKVDKLDLKRCHSFVKINMRYIWKIGILCSQEAHVITVNQAVSVKMQSILQKLVLVAQGRQRDL